MLHLLSMRMYINAIYTKNKLFYSLILDKRFSNNSNVFLNICYSYSNKIILNHFFGYFQLVYMVLTSYLYLYLQN